MQNARFIREGDVKRVIEKSTYTTTLKDLEKRGKNKVRVVKARQIYRLIAEAVNQMIAKSSVQIDEEEQQRLVEESRKELDRLVAQHQAEEDKFRDQQRKIEKHLRRELEASLERVAELRAENDELRKAPTIAAAPAPAPAPAPQVAPELMQDMLSQMASLREGFQELQDIKTSERPTEDIEKILAEREARFANRFENVLDGAVQQISDQVEERLDKRDNEIEAAKAVEHVEAAEVVLDSLFTGAGEHKGLESNISRVGVKKSEGGGIGANLARLKSLARKPIEEDA